ncbi:MACPF domain-containing protein CAD1 [Striga hermonthica]|uniref:MACPF domain-containing protein CAD1 n=1 Tax=Striga hermonthica TaxID=68872 RepID=A0A9N7NHG1_STRHE|nr:MACPF domain-containing protein CAD1 [Striga hermonthica]
MEGNYRATRMAVLILLLLSSAVPSSLAYRPGDIVPMSRMGQYHSTRTVWHDIIGRHCPIFAVNRETLIPIPKPTGYTGADPYKISLQVGHEKFYVPWLFVINRKSSEVPMIEMNLRYSGADLLGVTAKVIDMPNSYVELHPDIRKQFWDQQHWPKHILVRYTWEEQSEIDVASGFYVLFGWGMILSFILAMFILQSSRDKIARFVKETVAESSMPAGGVAKIRTVNESRSTWENPRRGVCECSRSREVGEGDDMGENAAALHTAVNSVQALGRGFDVNYDTRLLYCKGVAGSRIVEIDEEHTRDLYLSDDLVVPGVSRDIKNSHEQGGRAGFGVCSYNEMVEYFNKKASLSGHTPLGGFNAAFSYTGSRHIDAASTKSLCMDGVFIPIAKFQISNSALVLSETVRRAVPRTWDPPALASFIENFGTHVIISVTIGGKDVIYVRQHLSSPLSIVEIKNYVQDIGNQRFSSAEGLTNSGLLKYKDKGSEIYPQPATAPYLSGSGKEDVTVIFRRRGGDDLEQSHTQWARTVRSSPDVIEMSFFPITELLDGIRGKEHLTRAIALYLEYKPQIEELRYFLEFQVPRIWAPVQDRFAGQTRKEPVCPSLQFSMMGQKLYVSQEQVSVGRKPVTGMRLCLEGSKQNRVSIHLQHLQYLPKILQPYWDPHISIGAPKWQGPEEQDSRWFEPVKWKKFSHVSTAPIENPEIFVGDLTGVHIVTGAQLGVWDFGSRNVLYMKLLYSRLPGCTIRRSLWDHAPPCEKIKKRESVYCNNNSLDECGSSSGEVYGRNKVAKFVDCLEMSKGPKDLPGHWLVTGGKLGVEKGRIVVRVKYSLLNY